MPRRREVPKREILPDPKFGNVELVQVHERDHGRRQEGCCRAHHLWRARLHREEEPGQGPLEAFTIAINNVEADGRSEVAAASAVRTIRCRSKCAPSAAWPCRCAGSRKPPRKRGEKSMALRLASELMDATEGRGGAMKKRDEGTGWQKPTRLSATSACKINPQGVGCRVSGVVPCSGSRSTRFNRK